MNKILVAIPSYKCQVQIQRVLQPFAENPRLLEKVSRIVVIDNQSPDATIGAASEAIRKFNLQEKASVLRNVENFGLGGSHKVAFRIGREQGFDYVAILHGDNQAKTEELEQLIDRASENSSSAAILGARFHPKSHLQGYSLTRILGNIALNIFYSLITFRVVLDLGSGLNLFKVSELNLEKVSKLPDGFVFNMGLLLHFCREGKKLTYVPITWREEDQVSNAKAMSVGWLTLKMGLSWFFRLPPPAHFSTHEISHYQSKEVQ